jgi:hypothetical protein
LLDVHEEVPGGEMHIRGQIGNGRYWRRREAAALQRFRQRPALKTRGKLLEMRLHHVRMRQLVVPVAKGRVHENGILHQFYQPVPLMWLEEGEEDVAVLTAIIAVRGLWIAGAGAAQDVFPIGVAY